MAALCLGGPNPLWAEDPAADLGAPPTFSPEVGEGQGPGFSEKKKKDDDDGVSAGSILAVVGYALSIAGLYYTARNWPTVKRQGGEALRALLKSPWARGKMGGLATTLERLDRAEPRAFTDIEQAYDRYQAVFQTLANEMAKSIPGPPADDLDSAQTAWRNHVQTLRKLGLVRSKKMIGEVDSLIAGWSPRTPADDNFRSPDPLEQWLGQDAVRNHRLFTTEPGRQWLAEYQRLKGQFALQWFGKKRDATLFDQWAISQPALDEDWRTHYDSLRNQESAAAVTYTEALQSVLTRAARYALTPALKERLEEESKEPIVEPENFILGTRAEPGRRARQPGEFVLRKESDENWKDTVSASNMRAEVEAHCEKRFALFGRAAKYLREMERHPVRRLVWPAYVVTSTGLSVYFTGQGAWHLVLSPALKKLFSSSHVKTDKP